VPEQYRRIVKDVSIQAVRNAVVYGIEAPSVRLAAGKLAQGQVRLTFQSLGDGGYKFSVEDDGQGLAEYALILALIAIIAIVALIFMGNQVSNKLSVIGSAIQQVAP